MAVIATVVVAVMGKLVPANRVTLFVTLDASLAAFCCLTDCIDHLRLYGKTRARASSSSVTIKFSCRGPSQGRVGGFALKINIDGTAILCVS